ncbi:30S ribosomal protein S6 [Candidatus Cytomitobacter indipagum]|uniref:Small ribosomal subunit protein bS6 n=1 Tax=Candidatus Cytomitobacter indipagum TaxID=2601575 RepID=A0A5C0UDX4_9PROT|nr:30S ribosomal protein S6 [Candidatus Cytomitobacter indipagum]QEK37900.1 30S ribosomal protein S6 [Candidatus Cytomitobacter indipagum]
MRNYRLVCALEQNLSADEAQLHVEKIVQYIKENNGELGGVRNFGLAKTAYEMNRNARAHYFVVDFNLDPLKLKDMKRLIDINDKFLRDLIVKLDKFDKPLDRLTLGIEGKVKERKSELMLGESAFLNNLSQFISPYGKILSRYIIGISAKQMRCLSQAIKRARYIGLMPFRVQQ